MRMWKCTLVPVFALASVPVVMAACGSNDGGGGSSSGTSGAVPDGGGTDSPSGSDSAGNDTGTGDTGADAPATGIDHGPYTIVYAGQIAGIDVRPVADGKATFDGQKLTGYEFNTDERPTVGTNTVENVAGTSRYVMGRWAGGTTDGKFYNSGTAGKMTFAANGGFQFVIGVPADPLPATGSGTFTIDSKTVATVSDGTKGPGTITGSLAATFAGASTKIGLSLSLDVPGDATYTVQSTGGSADPSQSDVDIPTGASVKGFFTLTKTITSAGAACTGGASCSFIVDGFVGKNGDFVALVAHVFAGGGGSPKSVSGAIVFKK